MIGEYNEED